jgi:hypothetical protein
LIEIDIQLPGYSELIHKTLEFIPKLSKLKNVSFLSFDVTNKISKLFAIIENCSVLESLIIGNTSSIRQRVFDYTIQNSVKSLKIIDDQSICGHECHFNATTLTHLMPKIVNFNVLYLHGFVHLTDNMLEQIAIQNPNLTDCKLLFQVNTTLFSGAKPNIQVSASGLITFLEHLCVHVCFFHSR